MTSFLERIQAQQVQEKETVGLLMQLRRNARRSVPDWPECIHVSLTEDVGLTGNNWDVVLANLAGKLIHDNKPAMEMAVASPEPGVRTVWVRTG